MKQLTGPINFINHKLPNQPYTGIDYPRGFELELGFSWHVPLAELQQHIIEASASLESITAGLTGHVILQDLLQSIHQPTSEYLSIYYQHGQTFHGLSMTTIDQGWLIAVIENTIADDSQRRLSLFLPAQFHLSAELDALSQNISAHQLIEQICQTIHCPALKYLIAEALQHPKTALPQLKKRLHAKLNFDARDLKIRQLNALFEKFDVKFDVDSEDIWLMTQTRLDFFHESIYPNQLQRIYRIFNSVPADTLTSFQYANHIELSCLQLESELSTQQSLQDVFIQYAQQLRTAPELMNPNLNVLGDLIFKHFNAQHQQHLESLAATPAFTCLPVQHDDIAEDLWQKLNTYCQEIETQHHTEIQRLNLRYQVYLKLFLRLEEDRSYFLGAIDEGEISIGFQQQLRSQFERFKQQFNMTLQDLLHQNKPYHNAYQFYIARFGFKNAVEFQVKAWEKEIEQQSPRVENLPHPCLNLAEMHVNQHLKFVSFLKQKKTHIEKIYQEYVKQSISSPEASSEAFQQLTAKMTQHIQQDLQPSACFYIHSQHKKFCPADERQLWSYVEQQFIDWRQCMNLYRQQRRELIQQLDPHHRLYWLQLTQILLHTQYQLISLKHLIEQVCQHWLTYPHAKACIQPAQDALIAEIESIYIKELANYQQQLLQAHRPWYQRHQDSMLFATTLVSLTSLAIYWIGSSMLWIALPSVFALVYFQVKQIQTHEASHQKMLAEDIPQLTETLSKIAL